VAATWPTAGVAEIRDDEDILLYSASGSRMGDHSNPCDSVHIPGFGIDAFGWNRQTRRFGGVGAAGDMTSSSGRDTEAAAPRSIVRRKFWSFGRLLLILERITLDHSREQRRWFPTGRN